MNFFKLKQLMPLLGILTLNYTLPQSPECDFFKGTTKVTSEIINGQTAFFDAVLEMRNLYTKILDSEKASARIFFNTVFIPNLCLLFYTLKTKTYLSEINAQIIMDGLEQLNQFGNYATEYPGDIKIEPACAMYMRAIGMCFLAICEQIENGQGKEISLPVSELKEMEQIIKTLKRNCQILTKSNQKMPERPRIVIVPNFIALPHLRSP